MALRDKFIKAAQPHLQPGEVVQGAFLAVRANPAWSILSYWVVLAKGYYVVVATDRRTLVFRTSAFRTTTFKGLAMELPPGGLPEPTGRVNFKMQLGGENMWVHRRFWKELRAAS